MVLRPKTPEIKETGRKSPARSPARKKSPARTKSPTRTRSPARTRSPGRQKKPETAQSPPLKASTPKIGVPQARSPIGKSPTRVEKKVTKSVENFVSERITLRTRRPSRKVVEADTDSDSGDVAPSAAASLSSRQLAVKVEKIPVLNSAANEPAPKLTPSYPPRSFTSRTTRSREVDRIVHVKNFDNVVKKLGEFSDDDEVLKVRKSVSIERQPSSEFGGTLGAFFLALLYPLTTLALFITCNESRCSYTSLPPLSKYKLFSTYLEPTVTLGFFAYAVILAILSVIPFGGRKIVGLPTKQGRFSYVMNGFFSCVVLIAVGVGLEIKGVPLVDIVNKHLFQLFVAFFAFEVFVSLYAYIRSFFVPLSSLNAHVVNHSKFYQFVLGRELNPRSFGLLDWKLYSLRLALISGILLNFVHLYRSVGWIRSADTLDIKSLNVNPTLAVLVALQTIYFSDVLIYESTLLTTFDIQYEGFGYLAAVTTAVIPFNLTSITKYVADYNIRLATWLLVLVTIVFIFGYVLFRASNNQKDAFRKNPYDPALSHLETIPTTKGKKLICSGYWGVVRHPNYLGDILINLSFVPFAFYVPPALTAFLVLLFLVQRASIDNARCKQKYGPAWDRYCSKVKYILVPKVY